MTGTNNHSENRYRPAYEAVATKIVDLIATSGLKADDRLPTEHELGEQLGVSRTVVREAVKALAATGQVYTRKGSGLYVAQKTPSSAPIVLDSSLLIDPTLGNDIYEFRLLIEVPAARFAAERITLRELHAVRDAVMLNLEGARSEQRELFYKGDAAFHQAIAEASRNPFLASAVATVTRMQDWVFKLASGRTQETLLKNAGQHEAIFAAIQDGQPERAAQEMQAHLEWALISYQQEVRLRLVESEKGE